MGVYYTIVHVLIFAGNSLSPAGLWIPKDPADDIFYLQLTIANATLYFAISSTTKIAILCMYHRIFSVSPAFRYGLFVAGGLITGWWVGCTAATIATSLPLTARLADPRFWARYNIFWAASGACEILLDVLVLALPLGVVLRMRLSRQQKLTISGIFLLGGLYVTLLSSLSCNNKLPIYPSRHVTKLSILH